MVPIIPFALTGGFPYVLPFRLGIAGLKYHTNHFDQDWHINQLQDWQMKIDYPQKWQLSDVITNQYSITVDTTMAAAIYDCHGNKVLDVDAQAIQTFEGNRIYGLPAQTLQYSFNYGDTILNTGRYYFVLAITADEQVYLYISEPQEVKNEHLGTKLITYSNAQNRYGTFFSMNPEFNLRVEASLDLEGWTIKDTAFKGQNNENKITYSGNNRRFNLVIGDKSRARQGQIGVAKWMVDKVVNVLGCDTILIDGGQFVRNANTDPEVEEYSAMPLITATFKLFEQNIAQRRILGIASARYAFPVTYPYVISHLKMGGITISDETTINDLAGLEAIETYANTLGFKGTFALDGTTLVYTNARTETYTTIDAYVLTSYLGLQIDKISNNIWSGAYYQGGTIVVDFGNGSMQTLNSIGDSVQILKDYGGAPLLGNVRLWHNHNITQLGFLAPTLNGYSLTDFDNSSALPKSLVTLRIVNQYYFLNLDNGLFDDYYTKQLTLKNVIVKDGGLSTFTTNFFTSATAITYFDFRNNGLSSATIEDFTSALAISYNLPNGFIGLDNQNPTAAATPTTLANLAALAADGWTSTTD